MTGSATIEANTLDILVNVVVLEYSGENKDLGMAAMTALLAIVKDTQLLPLFSNTAFTDLLKNSLASESNLVRQSTLEVCGRILPRLISNLERPTTLSGTFPSTVDALVSWF